MKITKYSIIPDIEWQIVTLLLLVCTALNWYFDGFDTVTALLSIILVFYILVVGERKLRRKIINHNTIDRLNDTEYQLRMFYEAAESTPDAYALYDAKDCLVAYNSAYLELHKFAFEKLEQPITYSALLRATAEQFVAEDEIEDWVAQRVVEHREGSGKQVERQYPDGRWLRVSKHKTSSGAIVGFGIDITRLKRRELELSVSRNRYSALTTISPVGVWQLTHEGETLYANDVLCELFAYADQQDFSRYDPFFHLYPASEENHLDSGLLKLLLINGDEPVTLEATIKNLKGISWNVLIARSAPFEGDKKTRCYMLTIMDVTERKQAEKHIRYLAEHDELTGLPNRSLLISRIRALIENHENGGPAFSVALLDLDNFKDVNDMMGHPIGDALLRQVASRVNETTRGCDVAARLGGDEFAIILPNICRMDQLEQIAGRIVKSLTQPFRVDGNEIHIGVTVGIAIYPDHGASVDEILQHADIALYERKRLGRGSYTVFDPIYSSNMRDRKRVEDDLRRAIRNDGELNLYFQPQYNLASGLIDGVECLMRWKNAGTGEDVSPTEFIPVAEHCGLIYELDLIALREGCAQASKWEKMGITGIRTAINFSAAQFRSKSILNRIKSVLNDFNLEGSAIELEITEGIFLDESHSVIETLESFRSLGIRISIDDFGTGYSSLGYLNRLPVDTIKIDRSFVQNASDNHYFEAIVRCIIELSQSIGLDTIAEGIETEEQLQFLKSLKCNHCQGFYIAKPMTGDEVTELLRAQNAGNVVPFVKNTLPKK